MEKWKIWLFSCINAFHEIYLDLSIHLPSLSYSRSRPSFTCVSRPTASGCTLGVNPGTLRDSGSFPITKKAEFKSFSHHSKWFLWAEEDSTVILNSLLILSELIFSSPWDHQKTVGFLMLSGGREVY